MDTKTWHLIVTNSGIDGACSAAMVLLKYPGSEILVTSGSYVARTLEEIVDREQSPGAVHICGVGIYEGPGSVITHLADLKRRSINVFWYCGRGYLNEYRQSLDRVCSPIFKDSDSNTEAIRKHLKIKRNERVERLLSLARAFVRGNESKSGESRFWSDLVGAAASRYFRFGDRDSYLTAIHKLAGLEDITEADKRDVAAYRQAASDRTPIGNSPAMKRLRSLIAQISNIEEPVLILGPTGSGKELVARAIHYGSWRREGPFVPVNCGVMSTNVDLAHDRLFGHVAGAYTGAKTAQAGAFEAADGGTLFLDEVAELPEPIQAQLLRVLEERTITPLGTMQSRPVNVRLLAATNRDLQEMVRSGRFRSDLYFRLNVLLIKVPPLAERREDMKAIARDVIRDLNIEGYRLELSSADWDAAHDYDWPGNIRQFINCLKRAAYMQIPLTEVLDHEKGMDTHGGMRAPMDIQKLTEGTLMPRELGEVMPEAEIRKAYMKHVLELAGNNWTKAAKALGIAPNTLRKWLAADG